MTGVEVCVDEAGIAQLVMCRAEARNALSARQAELIARAATGLGHRPDVRVVVLSSSVPQFFSVGADLKERRAFDESALLAARTHSAAATRALLELAVPTIAAISGMALGGGLELALTCDVMVADATAEVGLPETGVGIIPGGGGTQLLPRRIGTGRAAELIFSGRRLSAAEAHAYGIVDVLVDDDAVTGALRLAATFATKSPTAQRNAKAALRAAQDRPLIEGLAVEDAYWRSSATSADYREGLDAFTEKRPLSWPLPAVPTSPHTPTGATA